MSVNYIAEVVSHFHWCKSMVAAGRWLMLNSFVVRISRISVFAAESSETSLFLSK